MPDDLEDFYRGNFNIFLKCFFLDFAIFFIRYLAKNKARKNSRCLLQKQIFTCCVAQKIFLVVITNFSLVIAHSTIFHYLTKKKKKVFIWLSAHPFLSWLIQVYSQVVAHTTIFFHYPTKNRIKFFIIGPSILVMAYTVYGKKK